MFTVVITSMPGRQQLLDVLPALRVASTGHVRVRELVDERHLGRPSDDRVDVHLLERRPAMHDRAPRHDLEVGDLLGGARAAVGLDVADHDVGAALTPTPALAEHREGLAHARREPDVDAQLASPAPRSWQRRQLVERQVQREHVHARAPRARRACARSVYSSISVITSSMLEAPGLGDARGLHPSVRGADVRVEAARAARDRIDRHREPASTPVARRALEAARHRLAERRVRGAEVRRPARRRGRRRRAARGTTAGPSKRWPSSDDPTTSPSRITKLPSARAGNATCPTPQTASGYSDADHDGHDRQHAERRRAIARTI